MAHCAAQRHLLARVGGRSIPFARGHSKDTLGPLLAAQFQHKRFRGGRSMYVFLHAKFLIAVAFALLLCLVALAISWAAHKRAISNGNKTAAQRRRERRLRKRRMLLDRRNMVRLEGDRRSLTGRRGEDLWDDPHTKF